MQSWRHRERVRGDPEQKQPQTPAMKEVKQPRRQQTAAMEDASAELERRSQYLTSLIQRARVRAEDDVEEKSGRLEAERQRGVDKKGTGDRGSREGAEETQDVRVRAADMPVALQERAFQCAREVLDSMPKLDNKRLALTLNKEFDSLYGPAWHCIVGRSFGSYVTHTLGGFLYFSIDKQQQLLLAW
ncbi:uncharacterized protein LOC103992454 isoform X2 [Musa acuminata AAA Group]|uniref:uncharacterized protein LOC103992454 isoform X2 n=1 Tax=Musa acuminata AAA Group TaxID=214697 RepID=UPI0031D287CC